VHYATPVHVQPAYRELGYGPGSLPESEKAAKEVLSLPLYPELTDAQIELVAQELATLVK
jgi:dTDP-4-amino-4,6-dideoxygalactose transaminase